MQPAHQIDPLYSDQHRSDHNSAGGERRATARAFTILRVARLTTDSDAGLCRIQNISDHGMMILTGLALAASDTVAVALSDGMNISGEVIWVDGARVGIQFPGPIDASAVLRSLAAERLSGRQRASRLPIDMVGVATTPLGIRAIRARNISQQGMQVAHDGSLVSGSPVKVVLENGLVRRGIVRWSSENVAGLRLIEPISYQELESASRL